MARFTKEELEDLTDEERDGIMNADDGEDVETEASAEEQDAAAKAAAGAEGATKQTDGEGDDGKDDDREKAAAGAADDDKGADVKAGEEAEAAKRAEDEKAASEKKAADESAAAEAARKPDSSPSVPRYQAPADADEKIKDIKEKKAALAESFDNGDLSAREYQTQLDELNEGLADIRDARVKAEMAADMREATWLNSTVRSFLDSNTVYRDNPILNQALDAEVRRLQVEAGEKGSDPFAPSILTTARDAINAAIGAAGGAAKAADPKPGVKDKELKTAAGERPELPPSLARVPAADINESGGRYDKLDALIDSDPEAFEDALRALPDHERERYLSAQ